MERKPKETFRKWLLKNVRKDAVKETSDLMWPSGHQGAQKGIFDAQLTDDKDIVERIAAVSGAD